MATAPEPVFEQTPKSWTLGELFEYSREKRNKKQFTRFICEEGRGLDDNELEFRIPQHQRFPNHTEMECQCKRFLQHAH